MDPRDAAETVLAAFGELPLHNDVRPGLERLHDQGLRLVTLTNGGLDNVTSLLERGGVAGFIERSMSVADVGRWKPAPEPYLYAAERCGVSPERVMLVAVHPWDIDGAKRAGLAACWIDRQRTPYPEPLTPPDISCDGFVELAWLLADAGPH